MWFPILVLYNSNLGNHHLWDTHEYQFGLILPLFLLLHFWVVINCGLYCLTFTVKALLFWPYSPFLAFYCQPLHREIGKGNRCRTGVFSTDKLCDSVARVFSKITNFENCKNIWESRVCYNINQGNYNLSTTCAAKGILHLSGYWSMVLCGLWGIENASNWFWVITKCTTEQIIENPKFSRFFIFFEMKFKNNVCFNLTTKT